MKKRINKRICSFVLIFVLFLSLTACDGDPTSETQEPVVPTEPIVQTDPTDALEKFRTDMGDMVMAIADFGFPELSEEFEIMDYLMDEYPNWLEEHDFIGRIPEERIVRTCDYDAWGNLLCIVPQDPASSITVTITPEFSQAEEFYRSETGEPVLLLADIAEDKSICVTVTAPDGEKVSHMPYWEYLDDPADDRPILVFSPDSEKTAYQNAMSYGWTVPDESFRTNHYWQSDSGCLVELDYEPDELYDGWVCIYCDDGYGVYVYWYVGNWRYDDGKLYLRLENVDLVSPVIEGEFPVLMDPYGSDWVTIFRDENGVGLPWFEDYIECDELMPAPDDSISPYDYAISEGWRLPELWELVNTNWNSHLGYGLDLLDDGVSDDNGGWAKVYDIDEIGAYTESYSGSWRYEDGMLYLSLVPKFEDGYLVNDSFPVLMLDGQLWIGRNSEGFGIPHFPSDMLADVLQQPMG